MSEPGLGGCGDAGEYHQRGLQPIVMRACEEHSVADILFFAPARFYMGAFGDLLIDVCFSVALRANIMHVVSLSTASFPGTDGSDL